LCQIVVTAYQMNTLDHTHTASLCQIMVTAYQMNTLDHIQSYLVSDSGYSIPDEHTRSHTHS